MTATVDSFEAVWKRREEIVYPELFGSKSRGVFVLDQDVFLQTFQQESVDPRWLHYGVFEFEPTEERTSWLYVTSGASNPWEVDPAEYGQSEYSGFGAELVFETVAQGTWPIVLLQRVLAFNVLLIHGRFGKDASPLDYGHRIPYRGPITLDQPSELQYLVIGRPLHFPESFQLASGKVDLLQVVGISEQERDYAKGNGSDGLVEVLTAKGVYPVTDPTRESTI